MSTPSPPRRRGWRRYRPLAVLLAASALAALLAGFKPSLSPLGLHPRGVTLGAARAQLLVDNTDPALADINPATQYQTELGAQLALNYALFLRSHAATQAIGAEVGLQGASVSASGPFTLLLGRTNYVQGPSLPEPRRVNGSYRLLTDADGARPVLSLYAQAPSAAAAVAIVEGAKHQLQNHVAAAVAAGRVPHGDAVVLRPLGPTVSGVVDPGVRWQLMLLAFLVVLCGAGGLMLARSRRQTRLHINDAGIDELDRLDGGSGGEDEWPHTRRALPWALAGFMAMLFLVPFDAIDLPLHLPVNGTLDRPVLVAIILLWVSSLAVVSGAARPRVRVGRVHFAALAFLAACLLSVVLDGHALADMGEVSLTLKKLALLISYIVFFFVAASVLRPREVPRFVNLMIGLGVIVALGTVIEYRFHYNVFYTLWGKVLPVTVPPEMDKIDPIGRLTVFGPTLQPLELAAMLAMVLPFALLGAIDAPERRGRWLYTFAVGILIAGGVATGRKTSLVVPTVVILVLAAYRPREILGKIAKLAIVLFVIVHLAAPSALGSVVYQLEPGHINTALTTTDRAERYDAVLPDLLRHPLIGRGYESYDPQKYRILDNQYLDLLITVGALGTALYLALLGSILSVAHPLIRSRGRGDPKRVSLALAAFASVFAVTVGSALFDVLSFPHVPYLLFFIAAMVLVLRQPSPAPEPARLGTAPPPRPRPDSGMPGPPPSLPETPDAGRRTREPLLV